VATILAERKAPFFKGEVCPRITFPSTKRVNPYLELFTLHFGAGLHYTLVYLRYGVQQEEQGGEQEDHLAHDEGGHRLEGSVLA